ncbi:MAG TPA: IS630 family transposase [Phycisphaerae bacterium]|nr:IS630 family transposase [Phycisphaerae bacterium]
MNDTRTLSPSAQEELRRRVVHGVTVEKMKKAHAARTFKVTRASIDAWLAAYQAGGEAGLAARKRGPKEQSRLTGRQVKTVLRLITGGCPDQLRLPFALWTREAVQLLLKKQFNVAVSVWTAGRYLKAWGLWPQRPARRAYEQDPQAVGRWLKEEYPAIKAQAKACGGRVRWLDETGLRSDHQSGTTWGLIGQTPIVEGTGKRFGCSAISAISSRGELACMVYTTKFCAPLFIRFLHRLIRLYPGKTFLIVDGHPVHRAALVKRWLAKHAGRIEMFFLPGYRPRLNPDELLNCDIKRNAGKQRPANQPQLLRQTRAHLRRRQRQPQIIKNFFRQEDVVYAA